MRLPIKLWHGADYNYEQWLAWPEVHDQDFAAMKEAGCNVMAVGIFSWAAYEPQEGDFRFGWMDRLLDRMHDAGIDAILATPSGSKPAWLSAAYPEVCQVDVQGRRAHHHGRHNHCRTSPVYREKVRIINTHLAQRYGKHPAVKLWHVSNEYNATRCYCDHCLGAFRHWLKDRYGTLDALNQAWWTGFWSHTFTAWDQIYPADSSVNGMMLDWARFTSDQTMDFYQEETRPLREFSPSVPITTNFMQPDVGLDYHRFGKLVDVVSWDSYPRWHMEGHTLEVAARTAFYHDLFRSCGGFKPFLLMESTPSNTNWQGVSPQKRPGTHRSASLQALAHGSDSVQYFQWRASRGGEEKFHGAVLDHRGHTGTRTFREVISVGRSLRAMEAHLNEAPYPVGATGPGPLRASVAVVYDFENSWALDLAQLPQSERKAYLATCQAHHAAWWKQGLGVDVISSAEEDLSAWKVLVLPMLYLVCEDFARRLEAWVSAGGCLVVTYLGGLVDQTDLCWPGGAPGPLAPILGLRVAEGDALPTDRSYDLTWTRTGSATAHDRAVDWAEALDLDPDAGVEVHGTYASGYLAGEAFLTRRTLGRGEAWYIAARTGQDFLDRFYQDLASSRPDLAVATFQPADESVVWPRQVPGLTVRGRYWGSRSLWFATNWTPAPLGLQLPPGTWRVMDPEGTDSGEDKHGLVPPWSTLVLTYEGPGT